MINRHKTKMLRRKQRTKAKIERFSDRPRLIVFRSNSHIYAQIIEQETGKVLAQASDLKIKDSAKKTGIEKATLVGKDLAKKALENKVQSAAFDRGSYKYHGRVKAVCDGARSENLVI